MAAVPPRSAAAAIAWELRRKHRWGWIAAAAYLLVIGTIRLRMLQTGRQLTMGDAESFAMLVMVPLSWTYTYLLAVVTSGLSGDIAARQSLYPARMFTLPVGTRELAGWPMLYGAIVGALLWAAIRGLAVWPSDIEVPVVWPALLAMALLTWAQALTWMPYGLRGMRVVVT